MQPTNTSRNDGIVGENRVGGWLCRDKSCSTMGMKASSDGSDRDMSSAPAPWPGDVPPEASPPLPPDVPTLPPPLPPSSVSPKAIIQPASPRRSRSDCRCASATLHPEKKARQVTPIYLTPSQVKVAPEGHVCVASFLLLLSPLLRSCRARPRGA
jgi:hypothetical protein